jgi:hypothetical protein
MPVPFSAERVAGRQNPPPTHDLPILLLSIAVQLILGLLFGHIYDLRIFMASGYLVGTGQNPYLPQDLSAVFHNPSFQGITTVGYPPPWPLVLGLIYRSTYAMLPNFLLYNLAIKIPSIAANIALAYLAAALIRRLGGDAATAHKAWIFMLLNPFLLYSSAAWGQFDSIVALIALSAVVLLDSGKVKSSAFLLALAISFKPTALPLIPVALFYMKGKSIRQVFGYYAILLIGLILFCVVPFFIFGWDPAPILQHWNAHFVVGGGLSFMAPLELIKNTVRLDGIWRLAGLAWIPALGIAAYAMRSGILGFRELLKKSAALILVFFLTRAWLSEPNILLVLPWVLILTSIGELDRLALTATWAVPLAFSFFNTATAQLFFPSLPAIMDQLLKLAETYRTVGLAAKLLLVIPWQVAGWWIVRRCFRPGPRPAEKAVP